MKLNWSGILTLLIVLAGWEAASRASPLLTFYFPPFSEIATALFAALFERGLVPHLAATLSRFALAYFLCALLAVSLGIVLGHLRWAYELLEVLIEFLRPMPSVAMIPVAILVLGIGDPMIVAVTVYAASWPILINTIDGVRNVEPLLVHTARTFRLGRARTLLKVILPAALPYIVTGLRVSLAIALILVTTAEMVVGGRGLGFFILDEERSLRPENMYAGILLLAILGYGLNRLFLYLEFRIVTRYAGVTARSLS